MEFMHDHRSFLESKGYNIKSSWTEIIQYSVFYSDYYIPAIEKLAFHLPHVYILGGRITVEVSRMECLWDETISITSNDHVLMHKDIKL